MGISGSLDRDFKTRRMQTDKNNVINTNRVFKRLKAIMVISMIYLASEVSLNAGIQFEYRNVYLPDPV